MKWMAERKLTHSARISVARRCLTSSLLSLALLLTPACNDGGDDDDDPSVSPPPSGQPSLALDREKLEFGSIDLETTATLTLHATNEGTGDLTLSASLTSSAEGPFVLIGETEVVVPPAESASLTVSFTPALTGEHLGTLSLRTNDEDAPEVTLTLTGNGQLPDEDGDGVRADEDCDDSDSSVYPDATEICDGLDNNCDGAIDEGVTEEFWPDMDQDGFGASEGVVPACEAPDGHVTNGEDCLDTDPTIYPGALESCNNLDDNCDGQVDEEVEDSPLWYPDADDDGYGVGEAAVQACEQPADYAGNDGDCDDTSDLTHPYADELCDGVDNDCDGTIDEEPIDTSIWYVDADSDGFGVEDGALEACDQPDGYAAQAGDCNDADPRYHPGADESNCADPNDYNCDGSTGFVDDDGDGVPACSDCDDGNPFATSTEASEACDGQDNNCNAQVDEGVEQTFWPDEDQDGYGAGEESLTGCTLPDGYAATDDDCDDAAPDVHPGADELCDNRDNDCDQEVDEDPVDPSTFYLDEDGDGYGVDSNSTQGCTAPLGYAGLGGDCNDDDPRYHPDADESDCTDPNDYNCDGSVGYADEDGDLYAACEDCDDLNATIFPDATETCNDQDDNCDGTVDEADAEGCSLVYPDNDGDAWGSEESTCSCSLELGYTTRTGDCDDTDPRVSPDADEQCNGYDDDCDGQSDEQNAEGCERFYADYDDDTWGSNSDYACVCEAGDLYSAVTSGDCDDTDEDKYPGNLEVCDGKDNNCSGEVDEGVKTTWYLDNDGDGFGASYNTKESCTQPTGYVDSGGDCNDYNAAIYPTAQELCDDIDNNCDGYADENLEEVSVYIDLDGDGHGAQNTSGTSACLRDEDGDGVGESAPNGYALTADDCDDSASIVYPGAPELCDARLNDCNLEVADYQCPEICEGVWPVYVGVTYGTITTGQFDGDNTREVVVQGANAVHVLDWDGSEKWSAAAAVNYSDPMVADVNLDGYMDVVLSENNALTVLNGLDGSQLETFSITNSGWRPGLAFDLDNDGILDLVGSGSTTLGIVLRDGAGGAKKMMSLSPPEGSYFSGDVAALTDVDGDGIAEVIIGTGYSTCGEEATPPCYGYLLVYDGATGELKYDPDVDFLVPTPEEAYTGGSHPFIADLDADGETEIFHWYGNHALGTQPLLWNYDGSLSDEASDDFNSSSPRVAPVASDGTLVTDGSLRYVGGAVADLEGDGLWEIIHMSSEGLVVSHAGETMDGFPVKIPGNAPHITDLNQDGRLDILYLGTENASLNCYTLGEDTYADDRRLTNGAMDSYASGIYRTGGYDPYEPNDVRGTPFVPETSTNPIVDARALPFRGFLDTYSSANGWTRSVTALLGHRGDRDYYWATGGQIRLQLATLVGNADYDLFLHMYYPVEGGYEYLTTWSSETEGTDDITCHSSYPCPDIDHTGTKLFIIEVAPKLEAVDYGPWPYQLRILWGAG